MSVTTDVIDALIYIETVREDDPELAELLMKAAVDYLEVTADQTIIVAEGRR